MKNIPLVCLSLLSIAALGSLGAPFTRAQGFLAEDLARRTVEAAIWSMPIMSFDAMREAFFRDAGAKYGDIVFWSKPSDWKNRDDYTERFFTLCLLQL
jgi:hypothetical protein